MNNPQLVTDSGEGQNLTNATKGALIKKTGGAGRIANQSNRLPGPGRHIIVLAFCNAWVFLTMVDAGTCSCPQWFQLDDKLIHPLRFL
jgi:hypothetical protein